MPMAVSPKSKNSYLTRLFDHQRISFSINHVGSIQGSTNPEVHHTWLTNACVGRKKLTEASSVADIQKAAAATVQDWCGSNLSIQVLNTQSIKIISVYATISSQWIKLESHLLARCQESRGHCSGLTKQIAKIGTNGKYPNNCERDLFRVLDLPIATGLTKSLMFLFCPFY